MTDPKPKKKKQVRKRKTTGNPVGHPPNLKSPEEAWELGQKYFAECDALEEPYLITGLALALNLASRQSLCEYERKPQFTDTIKKLKARVEAAYEKRAVKSNSAGAIFVLKNMGWSDRQDHTLAGPGGGPVQSDLKIEIVLRKPGDHKI